MYQNQHYLTAKTKAFTLIELLTVIAIIGILAAIIIPTVGKVRKSASGARALSNAKQIGLANLLYSQENKNKILGEGWTWDDSNYLWNNVARYLSKNPGNTSVDKTKINAIVAGLVDPLVPAELQYYGTAGAAGAFNITWSTNSIMNTMGGRVQQGLGESRPAVGAPNYPRSRLITEFREPSRTLYMISGSYQFTTTTAADAALLNEPIGRPSIFYYHGDKNKTPGVFLDGHTEMMTFPIAPERILPPS